MTMKIILAVAACSLLTIGTPTIAQVSSGLGHKLKEVTPDVANGSQGQPGSASEMAPKKAAPRPATSMKPPMSIMNPRTRLGSYILASRRPCATSKPP
jgi:hypothetical protein